MIGPVPEQLQDLVALLALDRLDQWPAPMLLALGGLLVLLVLLPGWLRRRARHRAQAGEREHLIALAQRAREIIASAPDGLFL